MASNVRSGAALRPLSPGDIISAGIQLYRNHLRLYLTLSVVSYLWLLVPIYGWAKHIMIAGLMSRFAFQELIDQPETVVQARAKLRARLWSFLWLIVQLILRLFGVYILGSIALFFLMLLVGLLIGALTLISPVFSTLGSLAVLGFTLWFLFIFIRILSRWYISEVPLTVEKGITAGQSIGRSWTLSQKMVGRIQIVAVLGFIVTWPLSFFIGLVTGWISELLFAQVLASLAETFTVDLMIFIVGWVVAGIVLLPFWQIIKAVLYYDLRCRQEGLDLELRD